jgi:predicted dehydrogenase
LFYRSGRSTLPADELKGYVVETDLQAALSHRPQAVIVANPTALHLDVAIPVVEAGCSLFLEKPISHTLVGLPELEAAVRRSGSKVLVGYQFRFHPGLRQVKQLVDEARSVAWSRCAPIGVSICPAGTPGRITARDTVPGVTWAAG